LFQSSNQIGIQIRAKLTSVAGAGHVQCGCNREYPDIAVKIDAGLRCLRRNCGGDEAGQGRYANESKKHAGNDSIFRKMSKDYT